MRRGYLFYSLFLHNVENLINHCVNHIKLAFVSANMAFGQEFN